MSVKRKCKKKKFLSLSCQRITILSLTMAVLASCATIPSLAPFEETTGRMVSGINSGYAASQVSMVTASPNQAKELAAAWKPTAASLNAIVAYSQALSSLATQGTKGADAADALAGAMDGLIGCFSLPAIPTQFVEVFKTINKYVDAMRRRKNLQDAVGEAQPAVNLLANILAAQLVDLAALHARATNDNFGQLRLKNETMVDYIEAERAAENRVLRILRRILDYQANFVSFPENQALHKEALDGVRELDPAVTKDNVEKRERHWLDVVKRHQNHIKPYAEPYATYLEQEAKLEANRRVAVLTFSRTQVAIHAWAAAHEKLKATLDKKQSLDIFAFIKAVGDIHEAWFAGQAEESVASTDTIGQTSSLREAQATPTKRSPDHGKIR